MNPITFYFPKQKRPIKKRKREEILNEEQVPVQVAHWYRLPNEIFLQIFSHLYVMDLFHLRASFLLNRFLNLLLTKIDLGKDKLFELYCFAFNLKLILQDTVVIEFPLKKYHLDLIQEHIKQSCRRCGHKTKIDYSSRYRGLICFSCEWKLFHLELERNNKVLYEKSEAVVGLSKSQIYYRKKNEKKRSKLGIEKVKVLGYERYVIDKNAREEKKKEKVNHLHCQITKKKKKRENK